MSALEPANSESISTGERKVSTGEDRQLRNLDILRAIAVLSVLSSHLAPFMGFGTPEVRTFWGLGLGRFGVLIFFVHTALVLMLSMERSSLAPQWTSSFYIQRIFRIYPLSIVCLIVVLACRVPNGDLSDLHTVFAWPSLSALLLNLALVQNFVAGSSISSPMWSLPFEIQMYLLLPGVFWFIRREGRNGIAMLVSASLIIAVAEKALFPSGPWLTHYFPCFMAGVLAYAIVNRKRLFPGAAWPFAILATGVAFCWSGLSPLAQWGACLALGIMIPLFRDIGSGVAAKAASLVARYSYGIYLSHLPLEWLCFRKLQMPIWSRWTLYVALVSIVPVALYHFLEAPMIRMGRRVSFFRSRSGCAVGSRSVPQTG